MMAFCCEGDTKMKIETNERNVRTIQTKCCAFCKHYKTYPMSTLFESFTIWYCGLGDKTVNDTRNSRQFYTVCDCFEWSKQ